MSGEFFYELVYPHIAKMHQLGLSSSRNIYGMG